VNRPDQVRRGSACVIAAVAVAALAAGCTNDNEPTVLHTPTADHPTPSTTTPTPDSAPTLTEADAVAAAELAVHGYLALFAEISADPDRAIDDLEHVAADRALAWATHQITTWRDDGLRGVGAQIVEDLTATAIVLDPDSNTEHDHPAVELTACIDVSGTDVVDQNGSSVVTADRLDLVLVDYVVTDFGWPGEPDWLVARDDAQLTESTPPEFVPCD
jgi:hypothetical protein